MNIANPVYMFYVMAIAVIPSNIEIIGTLIMLPTVVFSLFVM